MAKSPAEITRDSSRKYLAKQKAMGRARVCVFVPNTDAAKGLIKVYAKRLCDVADNNQESK